jgi:hypothetical protein
MLDRPINSWGAGQTQIVAVAALALLSFFSLSTTTFGQNAGNSTLNATGSPAAAAQSQTGVGQQVQLEGQLEIMYQDDFKGGRSKLLYSLKKSDGTRVPLQFQKDPPRNFLTGDHVSVSGQMSGGSLILYSGSTNVKQTGGGGGGGTTTSGDATGSTTTSIPVPNTFGAQYALIILVNFQDNAVQPYDITTAQNVFFGTASDFILENSYQQTSTTGDVVGWYTIPVSITTCDTSQIATAAQNAATAAGVNLLAYSRYVYAFPENDACGFAGASYVGGNPSQSWINGVLGTHVVNHELGHAFGLWHSHSLDCGTTATICSSGTTVEYGDLMDVMGTPQTAAPHYNAYQKERLGWLNYGSSPAIQTVASSGTYTLYPYELGDPGPNALKVLQSTNPATGAKTWYYLEARQAIGFDSFLTNSIYYTQNETTGVLVHVGTDGNGNTSDLLDMTPATPISGNWWDASLAIGQTFTDATAGVSFTTTAVSGTGATVQITMNGAVCNAANPTVSIAASQSQNVTSGTAVSFTATTTDNDSSGCAPATFNLADGLPSGWTGVWSTTSLSLSPGKSGSATLTVTSPVGTADGSYGVNVTATNTSASSFGGAAAATYVINSAPLSVSLTTNQSSYLPGQTVAISASMLYGTVPDAGASATLTVTSPRGRATTLSGTTGSNGVAVLYYKLSKNAPAGTYQAQYGTSTNGTSAPAATVGVSTSFTVQ